MQLLSALLLASARSVVAAHSSVTQFASEETPPPDRTVFTLSYDAAVTSPRFTTNKWFLTSKPPEHSYENIWFPASLAPRLPECRQAGLAQHTEHRAQLREAASQILQGSSGIDYTILKLTLRVRNPNCGNTSQPLPQQAIQHDQRVLTLLGVVNSHDTTVVETCSKSTRTE